MTTGYFLHQSEYLFRILIACLCGMVIGYERKSQHKVAGIRTHAIVALGAALIMVVSKYGFTDIPDYDASRMAAQIVSGVGFLGAGIIFVRNNSSISGLTTAAGIWATSGIGMTIGAGLYYLGIMTTILVIVVHFRMRQEPFKMRGKREEAVSFILNGDMSDLAMIRSRLKEARVELLSLDMEYVEDEHIEVEATFLVPKKFERVKLVEIVGAIDGITSVRF